MGGGSFLSFGGMPTFHSRFMYLSHLAPRFLGLYSLTYSLKKSWAEVWQNLVKQFGPRTAPLQLPHDRKEENKRQQHIKNSRYDYSPTQACYAEIKTNATVSICIDTILAMILSINNMTFPSCEIVQHWISNCCIWLCSEHRSYVGRYHSILS